MQIYFHSRLCSYLSRVPILVEDTVINIHSTHTYIMLRKLLFWMRLIAINRLTGLVNICLFVF